MSFTPNTKIPCQHWHQHGPAYHHPTQYWNIAVPFKNHNVTRPSLLCCQANRTPLSFPVACCNDCSQRLLLVEQDSGKSFQNRMTTLISFPRAWKRTQPPVRPKRTRAPSFCPPHTPWSTLPSSLTRPHMGEGHSTNPNNSQPSCRAGSNTQCCGLKRSLQALLNDCGSFLLAYSASST